MFVRFEWHGESVLARLNDAAAEGVNDAGEHLLGVSRDRAPIEEGNLGRSGAWIHAGNRGSVVYNTPYAVRQHEELTWQHDPGKTAKYLEGPADEERETMRALVAARIRRALAGGA